MTQKNDLRVIKTRKAILAAFIYLYNVKGYDRLTVQDIATTAQINRNTFYLHYQDKDDLLRGLTREHLKKLTRRMGALSEPGWFNQEIYTRAAEALLHAVREDLDFYQAMLWKNPNPYFTGELKRVLRGGPAAPGTDDLRLYVGEYMLSGLLGVLARWIQTPEKPFPLLDPVLLDIQREIVGRLSHI